MMKNAKRSLFRVALRASLVTLAGCGEHGPSEPQRLVMDTSDASVTLAPITAGDTALITITNNHPTLTLVHGGLAARIDVWNGWEWAILIPGPNAPGDPLLVKRDLLYLAPGESATLEVDAASRLAPGEYDLKLDLGFILDPSQWPYLGGLRPTVRLVVSPPAPDE